MTEDNIFETPGVTAPASYYDQLVGDGKPYKTVEDLAKAVHFKEQHIKTLEPELADLRGEVSALKAVKTVESSPNSDPVIPTTVTPPLVTKTLTDEDLEKRIRETTTKVTQEDQARANLSSVAQKMVETFGDETKAAGVIKTKAQELGVSPAFLKEIAAKSPKAFYAQIGLDSKDTTNPAPVHSTVNSAALTDTSSAVKPGTYKWFKTQYPGNKILAESVQNQMHKAALEQGDAFYA